MKASELIAALEGISPDAEVRIWGRRNAASQCKPGEVEGPILYVCISEVDGKDTLVMLCNSLDNRNREPVFDAPPQIKRFKVSTKDGLAAAAADLQEQANREPTQDLAIQREVEAMREIFRGFEDLLRKAHDR